VAQVNAGSKKVLILRLKQAESAMADGRLDEAFDLVQSDSIREHRRGQKLISRLAEALARRGRENLDSERIQLALLDCNKAEKLAGNITDVAKLRSAICSEMEQKRLRNRHRSFKVAQARQQIEDGWLSAGEQILKEAGESDSQADMVRQQANVARLQIGEAVTKAEKALQRDDLDGAINIVLKAGAGVNQSDQVVELLSKVRSLAKEKIRKDLEDGRINLAQCLWQRISPLANGSSEMSELGLALKQCRQAADHIAAGRPRAALPLLRKVKSAFPTAKWLTEATEQAKLAAESLDELAASPLGLDISDDTATEADTMHQDEDSKSVGWAPPTKDAKSEMVGKAHTKIPSKFVLQMDGIGSFIVLRDQRITIGPVSSSARPTIGLMADPNLPVAVIERSEEDYFLRSASPINVNGSGTTSKLLADGDRIALSPRCVMRFNLPNPASTTATLSLTSGRVARGDVRRIILMDRDILVGPSAGDHIASESLEETMALFVQNGLLLCKAKDRILIDEKVVSNRAGLPVDKQIRIGQVSLVLSELKE
jgi:hypothetical protein